MSRWPRDSQRSRLYRAEACLRIHDDPIGKRSTLDEVRAWLRTKVMCQPWFVEQFGEVEGLDLRDGRGTRRAWGCSYGPTATLSLPRWARKRAVVLHELAHALTPSARELPGHGPEFCGAFLFLVRNVMGGVAAAELEESMSEAGVRWTRPLYRRCVDGKVTFWTIPGVAWTPPRLRAVAKPGCESAAAMAT